MSSLEVISEGLTSQLWDMLYDKFGFNPNFHDDGKDWITVPYENKKFTLNKLWTGEQEALVNSFFEDLVDGEMFALDWQHDCFSFSPKEHIPYHYKYHDHERNCNVYFPTYYPNGDYHMFFDKELNYGLFGHPWKDQIIVIGKELISKFESNRTILDLKK